MIHWLDDLDPAHAPRVGGKAAPLAALAADGLPVPPGFVVDTTAYEALVASQPALERAFEAAGAHPAEAVASALVPAIQGATLPTAVVEAVIDAYAELAKRLDVTDPPVAVRSSAVGEDGAGASFAGQQATYLHVCGASSVVAAVRACWSGLWSERAVAYRRRLGDETPPAIAVLVQAMVVPEVAGVAFSVHPVTGARDEVVIDASWGLGEAVVSGRATPDHVIVDKATGAIRRYMLGDKEVEVVASGAAGVDLRDVAPDRRKRRALGDEQVRALAALATDVERRRGAPQDLEWAYAGGRLYLLQARPITGLPPAPPDGGWTSPVPGARLERRNFAEHLPGPLSPLAETLVLPAVSATLPGLAREVGMRLPEPALVAVHGYAYARVDLTPGWELPFRALSTAAETVLRDPQGWERSRGGGHAARMRLLLEHPPEPTDAQGHVAWAEAFVEQFAVTWRDLHRLSGGWRWSEYVLRWALGGQILAAGALLQGFDSPAFDLERRLHALGQAADADVLAALAAPSPWEALVGLGARAEGFRARLERVRREGGHLPASFDPAVPMPFDDPDAVCRLVLASGRQGGPSPEQRRLQLALARDAAERQVLAEAGPLKRALLAWVIPLAQRYAAVREPALATLGHGWQALRERLLALGALWAGAGRLASADDLFWLRWDEVRAMAEGGEGPGADAIAHRRATTEAQAAYTPPMTIGAPPERTLGRAIAGVPASPGRVTGVVRVVRGPEDFETLAPGEILVATATTPAWTPLFHLAAAIVTDVGGPLSHGSIVAREFRIPAVLGTASATRRLKSGDVVTVDGDYGLVWLGEG